MNTVIDNFKIIPQGTFTVLHQLESGRFRSRLKISGPIADYTNDEILLHFGGNAEFGDRVERYPDSTAWVSVWSD